MLKSKYNLKRTGKIERWDEGFPIGNGDLGVLIFGGDTLCFSLDKAGLWDTTPAPETLENGFTYANMERLVKSGKEEDWNEFLRLFNHCAGYATPTKINAGFLDFDFSINENTQFLLDITCGEVCVSNNKGRIRSFVSATRKLGVALLQGDVSFKVRFPEYYYGGKNADAISGAVKRSLGYELPVREKLGNIVCYMHKTPEHVFGIAYFQKQVAKGTELFYYVFDEKDEETAKRAIKQVFFATKYAYVHLKKEQKVWWTKYWQQSNIDIPDKQMEKFYYLSYYLFGSGSRLGGYPMPLQGLWTACDGNLPPWKGDYHHDLNTQFTYMSYLRANRIDAGKCFVDYLWNCKPQYERFAKDFYGVDGLLAPATSTVDGKPIGGWPMYTLSPTMSIWLAKSFDDYYCYTGDETFFYERAYPFFEGVGKAILGLLQERGGKLFLPLSSSPEYGDCTRSAFMEWSNNDLQLVRYLCEVMIKYRAKIGKTGVEYSVALEKLDEFYVDKSGILLLDKENRVKKSHRHHSHLMCIYPLQTLKADTEENEGIIRANVQWLETLGSSLWVGFSFPWYASVCAMVGEANRAKLGLEIFYRCYLGENGFHLNGDFKNYGVSQIHYRPFTLEANFAYCDGVQNMLVQDHLGYIDLFPCIPYEWKNENIAFEGFLSQGVTVSARYKDGNTVTFYAQSKATKRILMKNSFGKEELAFSNGEVITCKKGEVFALTINGEVAFIND